MMEQNLPNRKGLRLKQHDYSSRGAYFVTICTQDRKDILSAIVGDGALDIPHVQLSRTGKTVEKVLLSSEKIPGVKIDQYVIMPDHIHVIIFLDPSQYTGHLDGTSRAPSPTNEMLPHVISTFKRFCLREIGSNIFQRSYIEHVIRDRDDYDTKMKYIHENPVSWYYEQERTDK